MSARGRRGRSSSRTAWTRSARSATASPSCAQARRSRTLERGAVDAARARAPDDRLRSAHRARRARRRRRPPAARRRRAERQRVCGCVPTARPIDVEIRAGELVGVAGLEGHGQDEFLDALRGAGPPSTGEIVRHGDGATSSIRSTTQAADARHRLRPARAPAGAVRLDVDPRELRHADAGTRQHGSAGCGPRLTRRRLAEYIDRARHRARPPGRRDHDAQRRQPAEGRDRPLARGGPAACCCSTTRRAASTSARSATSTGCSTQLAERGRGGRDAVLASSTSTSS